MRAVASKKLTSFAQGCELRWNSIYAVARTARRASIEPVHHDEIAQLSARARRRGSWLTSFFLFGLVLPFSVAAPRHTFAQANVTVDLGMLPEGVPSGYLGNVTFSLADNGPNALQYSLKPGSNFSIEEFINSTTQQVIQIQSPYSGLSYSYDFNFTVPQNSIFDVENAFGLGYSPNNLTSVTLLSGNNIVASAQPSVGFPDSFSLPGTTIQPNTTYTLNVQGSSVGNFTLTGVSGAAMIVGVNPAPSAPPTLLELAKMSASAYTVGATAGVPSPIDEYKFVKSVSGPGGFAAEVFQNGNQIAISFRGTDTSNLYSQVKTLLADSSFTDNSVDPDFYSQLNQAAQLVASYAGDNVTLTGHSLGAAIAQIIGADTGLPTVGFDAPGAGGLLTTTAVQNALSPLQSVTFSNNGANTNIRMYGDQISLVGTPIGTQQTIATTSELQSAVDDPLTPLILTADASHSYQLMVAQLTANAPITSGDSGPKASITIPVAQVVGQGFEYLALPVVAFADNALDPAAGTAFLFTEESGPPLYALRLPDLDDVTEYDLEEFINNKWGPDILLAPLQNFDFDSDVAEFQFWALDANGNDLALPSGIPIDVQFAGSGQFTGEVVVENVPEPSSLSLFIFASILGILIWEFKSAKFRRGFIVLRSPFGSRRQRSLGSS